MMRNSYIAFDRWLIEQAKNLPAIYCENDPIINPPPPNPPEPEPRRGRRLTCEACDCILSQDGGVITVSAKWKKLREAEREINDLQGRLETAQHDLEVLRAPTPEPTPEPNGPPVPVNRPARSTFVY